MIPQQSNGAESIGTRIARLRAGRGWTQQQLAYRLAMSRVAVSHLESGLSVPSERTIVVLAGLFGCEPHELVQGTAYPAARAERLPLVGCRYTLVDLICAQLERDLHWAAQYGELDTIRREWGPRLQQVLDTVADSEEQQRIREALRRLYAPVNSGP